jgi:hypothetical protein
MSIYESNIELLETVCQEIGKAPSAAKNILMPRAVRYRKLSASAKVVMAELLDRYNIGTGRCDTSRSVMIKFLKISASTFSLAIEELEKSNLIHVDRAPRLSKVSNKYAINWGILRDKTSWDQRRKSTHHRCENHTDVGMKIKPSRYENRTNWSENHTDVGMKIVPSRYENHTLTRETTRELTRESNKTNEQLLTRASPSHRSALSEDLTSERAFDALVVVQPTSNEVEPTSNGSDFSYKNKKVSPASVTPVDAGNELPEGDLSYKNKKAPPAPVMAVGADDEMTAEELAEELAACRKMDARRFDDDMMW